MTAASLPPLLQRFFTDRLCTQLDASSHTTACYRDTFRLLLRFASQRLRHAPSALDLEDLNAAFLVQFLDHVERTRGCSARTRNIRLSALHSFFRYVALEEPQYALHCQRVLAIPAKRHERRPVEFLVEEEITALVATPDPSTWIGRRDRTLLLVAAWTGLRSCELTGLRRGDVTLGTGANVRCYGKGRNYDDLGIMRSFAPRTLVCPSAMGYAWQVRGVNCA